MTRSAFTVFLGVLCIGTISCASGQRGNAAGDPFVGFFAEPSSGILELKRGDAAGTYSGSMWVDFGPFPVALTRDGNVARGTVTYGDADHPLQVEHTPKGLVLTASGTRAEAPLKRYKDMATYQKWFEAQGGYKVEISEIEEPTSKPAK